jgi:hypothetical protein
VGGYSPKSRAGLIALIAARRIKAEKLRREKLAKAATTDQARTLEEDAKKERRSGWFRR